jgi:transcriptional regulator with XRE-family HTH domain
MQATPIEDLRTRLVQLSGRYPEISERSGVSYSWLSKFARGERGTRASFGTISKLQAALDGLDEQEKKGIGAHGK